MFKAELVRYLSTGALDTSFGNGGFVTVPAGASAGSVALQPDGKILLAGASPSVAGQFVVTRLNTAQVRIETGGGDAGFIEVLQQACLGDGPGMGISGACGDQPGNRSARDCPRRLD